MSFREDVREKGSRSEVGGPLSHTGDGKGDNNSSNSSSDSMCGSESVLKMLLRREDETLRLRDHVLLREDSSSRSYRAAASTTSTTSGSGSARHFLNYVWRKRVVEWYFNVVDRIEARRDLAYHATSFLDRYVASVAASRRTQRGRRRRVRPLRPEQEGNGVEHYGVGHEQSNDDDDDDEYDEHNGEHDDNDNDHDHDHDHDNDDEALGIDSRSYQAIATTALLLAARLYDGKGPTSGGRDDSSTSTTSTSRIGRIGAKDLIRAGNGRVEVSDVSETTGRMLSTLSWTDPIAPPSAFVGPFLRLCHRRRQRQRQRHLPSSNRPAHAYAAGGDAATQSASSASAAFASAAADEAAEASSSSLALLTRLHDDAVHLAELSLADPRLVGERPSVIGYAAVLHVLDSRPSLSLSLSSSSFFRSNVDEDAYADAAEAEEEEEEEEEASESLRRAVSLAVPDWSGVVGTLVGDRGFRRQVSASASISDYDHDTPPLVAAESDAMRLIMRELDPRPFVPAAIDVAGGERKAARAGRVDDSVVDVVPFNEKEIDDDDDDDNCRTSRDGAVAADPRPSQVERVEGVCVHPLVAGRDAAPDEQSTLDGGTMIQQQQQRQQQQRWLLLRRLKKRRECAERDDVSSGVELQQQQHAKRQKGVAVIQD